MRQSIGRFTIGLILVTGVGAGTGLAAALATPGVAGATTPFTVNDTGDYPLASSGGTTCVSTNGGSCTLRAAIEASNNLDAPMTIDLPNGTYTLNDATYGALVIDDLSGGVGQLVTILGNNASLATIQASATEGAATTRVLEVDPDAAADISGVTIANGDASTSGDVGGGILNSGSFSLTGSVVSDNQTNGGEGGGIYTDEDANTTLTEDTIIGNMGSSGGGIYADAGTMDLDGVVVSDNTASGSGGGVYTVGTDLTMTYSTIGGTGSGESATSGNTAEDGSGGGLGFFGGTVTLSDNVVGGGDTAQGNTAVDGDGGGVYDSVEDPSFTSDAINNNTADNGDGGGVYVANGTSTFTDETIVNNLAEFDDTEGGDGGGVYIDSGTTTFSGGDIVQNTAQDGDDGDGGGGGVFINDGTNSFSAGTVATNSVTDGAYYGGGFFLGGGTNTFTSETIGGSASIDGNTVSYEEEPFGEGGGVYIDGGTNTFSGGSIDFNQAYYGGGGATEGGTNAFTGTTVDSNQGYYGGGFYYDDGTNTFSGGSIDSNGAYGGGGAFLDDGTETFTQTDISSNTASEAAGGLWISVNDIDEPTTITSSTISQNTVPGTIGESPFLGDGGGILADSCYGDNQINLTNDTIAGNSANALGGGYYGTDACFQEVEGPAAESAAASHATPHVETETAVTNFLFDTVDANSAGEDGGNINTVDASVLNAADTIIADGVSGEVTGTNCTFSGGGTLTSGGYNLIDDTTCGTAATGDIIGQGAQLGALGDNGGPTNTELPATTSPAVGGVPAAVCTATGVTSDQRGNARGAGLNGSCTIGAVEVSVTAPPAVNLNGYRLVANEGGIFDFGLNFHGSLANNHLNAPIVGIANSPGYDGYLMAGGDGGVFALGGANFYGSLGGQTIPSPISAIAAPPAENGYWLVAQNGKIYNFGAVPALPALSVPSGAHIVGAASTQDGAGLWLTDNLGDVYAEGDALYEGGLGGVHLNAPIVGIAAAASGQGYVLAASDGGVFNYGTQHFFGSVPGSLAPGQKLTAPIVGIAVTHSGNGYWLAGSDGGVFNYGDAPFLGSIYTAIGNHPLNGPVVGIQHLGELPTP